MRRVSVVSALIAAACAGGQTGEITELTACHEAIGVVDVGEASEAGRSALEQLAALTTAADTALTWEDAGSTPATVAFALTGEPATLLGGAECARPWLEAPVTLTVRTADGALDETIEGTVLLANGTATVRSSIPVSEMHGALELDASILRVDLQPERDALRGQLSLVDEDETERALASF